MLLFCWAIEKEDDEEGEEEDAVGFFCLCSVHSKRDGESGGEGGGGEGGGDGNSLSRTCVIVVVVSDVVALL